VANAGTCNPFRYRENAMKTIRMTAVLLATAGALPAFGASPQTIDVTLGSYYINPNTIRVHVDQPVRLAIHNTAMLIPHDLAIHAPDAGIDFKRDVPPGDQAFVTFTPTKAGTYEMMCDKKVPFGKTHFEKGMHGTLEVLP